MTYYTGKSDFRHGESDLTGVLMVNLGSPETPDAAAVRRYLAQFLWDRRVVEFPRWLWWMVLHGIILRIRPSRSAHAYKQIWTDQGSPLTVYSQGLCARVAEKVRAKQVNVKTALAMCYGEPSVQNAIKELSDAGMRRLLVLPLYPQYSATTTGAVFDAVARELQRMRWVPELRFINDYHADNGYIQAVADSIRQYWREKSKSELLLFSFHGIPQRYFKAGDPYHCFCHASARLIANALELTDGQWRVTFQSRFGREPWLTPYTDETLKRLPSEGITGVDVVCPGFAVDCLETLEEIGMQNREFFQQAGGQQFQYIPCLNDNESHAQVLTEIITNQLQGWPADKSADELRESRERALASGAKQ